MPGALRITGMRLFLLVCLAAVACSGEVEIATADRKITGTLISEDESRLVIRQRTLVNGQILEADIPVPRAKIIRRRALPSLAEQYAARRQTTPADQPQAWAGLAQWAFENGMRAEAAACAQSALSLDPEMAWALRILANCGFIQVEGRWRDEAEWLASQGKQRVGPHIVPIAIAGEVKALRSAVATRRAMAEDLAAKERERTALQERIATITSGASERALMDEITALQKQIEQMDKMMVSRPGHDSEAVAKRDASLQRMVDELSQRQAKHIDQLHELTKDKDALLLPLHQQVAVLAKEIDERRSVLAAVESQLKVTVARLPPDEPAVQAILALAPETEPKPPISQEPARSTAR